MSELPTAQTPPPRLSLILGGARSGKSRYAEGLILKSGLEPIYIATAQPLDDEMAERIARHRVRRGANWQTIEEPLALVNVLASAVSERRAVLVDCLTLWITNLMMQDRNIDEDINDFIDALDQLKGVVVFVSNEVGQGVMPLNAMAREFIDIAGSLHQRIADRADRVVFLTAGLPHQLKP
jgi:adenosylcobinamide kinase/adenosylcobinamide-phosphate guanylyltransferase